MVVSVSLSFACIDRRMVEKLVGDRRQGKQEIVPEHSLLSCWLVFSIAASCEPVMERVRV